MGAWAAHSVDIDLGFALWKIYMRVDDWVGNFAKAVAAGAESTMEPTRLDRWPFTAAVVNDLDGDNIGRLGLTARLD